MDTITERLALLTLDNKHRTLTEDADLRLGYGLSGALVMDLMLAGALAVQDGALTPRPSAKLKQSYLKEAFAAIPSFTAVERGALMRSFYDIMPRLKVPVLDALVERGVLKADTSKLKWSFALKTYMLKQDESGYRHKAIQSLLAGKVPLTDFWVLQLAATSRLLWAEEGESKKTLRAALAQIRHLQSVAEQGDGVLQEVAAMLPDTIATSHKLPKLGKKSQHPLTWEWRGFWADKGATLIRSSALYEQSLADISFSELTDVYLVVEGMAENIKWRKHLLEVKRPQESVNGYTAFSAKECYDFPLMPKQAARLFAQLPPPEGPLAQLDDIVAYLQSHHVGCERVEVRKKRFQLRLQSQVKVEFCTLYTGGRKFLSLCVEGPDYDITAAHSHNFQSGEVMVMNYVEFLKHCQTEPVA